MSHGTDKTFFEKLLEQIDRRQYPGYYPSREARPGSEHRIDKLTRVEKGANPPAYLPDHINKCVDQQSAHLLLPGSKLYWSEKRKILLSRNRQISKQLARVDSTCR